MVFEFLGLKPSEVMLEEDANSGCSTNCKKHCSNKHYFRCFPKTFGL